MITNVSFTTKEKDLLEDQKNHEQICILKYSNYANLACDQELKDIFNGNKKQEVEHINTINQLLSGQVPSMNNQQGESSSQQSGSSKKQQSSSSNSETKFKSSDKELCSDILMTEKFVSSAYNTAIFEFREPAVRNVLNHIQKEEQQHGEAVYKYMESKGMYNAQ